jgi:hypothetical protein
MLEADIVKWSVIAICAVMVGIAKTGIPVIGILVLKRIQQKWFRIIVQILAAAAAIKLIIP